MCISRTTMALYIASELWYTCGARCESESKHQICSHLDIESEESVIGNNEN